MTDRHARVVLDATAVAAYAATSDHVGELLRELADEGVGFAVSAASLIEGARGLGDAGLFRLDVLLRLPHAQVWPLDETLWRQHAAGVDLLGSLPAACAAVAVTQGWATYVLTADPDVYGDAVETIPV